MGSRLRRLELCGLVDNQAWTSRQGTVAPAIHLTRMQLIFGGELRQRLLFLEDVLDDLGFEGGRIEVSQSTNLP